MSRQANCWDLAGVESFFSTRKVEQDAKGRWDSLTEACHDVFGHLGAFCAQQRLTL